jgi:Leucine-rich repeat (LRR) protein
MCIICTGDYDESLTKLDCDWCYTITEIPDTLTNLTTLDCYGTKVTTIPDTLINLTTLSCYGTKVTTIPDTLTNLTTLSCYGTKVTTIPDTLTKLKHHLPKCSTQPQPIIQPSAPLLYDPPPPYNDDNDFDNLKHNNTYNNKNVSSV